MDGRVVMALASGASGATRVSSILTPFNYLFSSFTTLRIYFLLFLLGDAIKGGEKKASRNQRET
ncbi:hypothetical protein C7212DRAFT_309474, partial [Tuber magnatum]